MAPKPDKPRLAMGNESKYARRARTKRHGEEAIRFLMWATSVRHGWWRLTNEVQRRAKRVRFNAGLGGPDLGEGHCRPGLRVGDESTTLGWTLIQTTDEATIGRNAAAARTQ